MNQDYHQVLVSNNRAILTSGTTVDLAYGQLGIFDAERYQAVTAPSYLKNKALIFAQGNKDRSGIPKGAGIANETTKTKTVLGKKITDFKGKKAKRGQTQKIAIGYDGIDTTKTISAKPGEIKYLYVKLTGKPIENLYPGGTMKRYAYQSPCIDTCDDNGCTLINPLLIAQDLKRQIDQDFLIASSPLKNWIKVTPVTNCATPPTGATLVTYDKFTLTLQDTGDDFSLGLVQSQYVPKVTRLSRTGITSVYSITVADGVTPTDFTNAGAKSIPNCTTCPAGYTYSASNKVYQVLQSASIATAPTGLPGQIGTAVLIQNNNGFKVYEVHTAAATVDATFQAAVNALAGGSAVYLGLASDVCNLTTPTTTAWVAAGSCSKAQKNYALTIKDDSCGNSFLTQMQAIYEPVYGAGTVSIIGTDAAHCLHKYQLIIQSDECFGTDCTEITWEYTAPPAFKGIDWEVIPPVQSGVGCVAGLLFESALIGRKTSKCYYDIFPYEVDGIHIELSEHNPDWHGDVCATDWPVTPLQEFEYPAGNGEYVIRQEEKSNRYKFQYYSQNLDERLAEEQDLVTDPSLYYDQYSLFFEFSYKVGMFTETYTDSYQVDFFFPESNGKAFEAAVNSYIASAQIGIDPVVL